MESNSAGKQYGLILSKKKQPNLLSSKPSIFGNDSDSDNEINIEKRIRKENLKKQTRKQTQLEIQRAIEEDPTVYEYDSIYDDIKEKKETKKKESVSDKKPKYIESLLKTAEKRKKDYERRVERKIQIEREEEGEQFADKEAFVTSAYKKKMQEQQEEEEREKRMDVIEAMMDVTKQKDLSGFYRNLLKKTTDNPSEDPLPLDIKIKEEPIEPSSAVKEEDPSTSGNPPKVKAAASSESKAREAISNLKARSKSQEKGTRLKDRNAAELSNNKADADSDFSIDSASSSDSDEPDNTDSRGKATASPPKPSSNEKRKCASRSPESRKRKSVEKDLTEENGKQSKERDVIESEKSDSSASEEDSKGDEKVKEVKKPVMSAQERLAIIFGKRTVGDVFDAARERYLLRKQASTTARTVFSTVPVN